MFKPYKTAVQRSFQYGLWLRYRMSPHQMQLHFKIHRLQVLSLTCQLYLSHLLCFFSVVIITVIGSHSNGHTEKRDSTRISLVHFNAGAKDWEIGQCESKKGTKILLPIISPNAGRLLKFFHLQIQVPSVRWHCWLGVRKGIRPVNIWLMGCWHGYLLEWSANSLHMVRLMPLPPTPSSLLQQNPEWFILLVPTHPGSPGQRIVKWS